MDERKELAYIREIEDLQAKRDEQFLEIQRLKSMIEILARPTHAPSYSDNGDKRLYYACRWWRLEDWLKIDLTQ